MLPFYKFIENYENTLYDKRSVSWKYQRFQQIVKTDPFFPKGNNLINNFEFWLKLLERYIVSHYSIEELKSLRRLFTTYEKFSKNSTSYDILSNASSFYTDADTGGYKTCFSVKEDVLKVISTPSFPEEKKLYYQMLVLVYDEFNSLYVLPPEEDADRDSFISWWLMNNLPSSDNIVNSLELTLADISALMEECTSLKTSECFISEVIGSKGLYFDKDLPIFRRKFIKEPSKAVFMGGE